MLKPITLKLRCPAISALATLFFCTVQAGAMDVTGYSTARNDRFASGFPTAPIRNTDPDFVGAGLDWSGVAWSTTLYSDYKGFAMLSPAHFLTVQHYEYTYNATQGVRILGRDDQVHVSSGTPLLTNLGHGILFTLNKDTPNEVSNYDLALATLPGPVSRPSSFFRPGVLDLHDTSTSYLPSAYSNLPLLLAGRSQSPDGSPRAGATPLESVITFENDLKQAAIRTTRNDVQLRGGDSGHGAFTRWTNPQGIEELALLGAHSATDETNGWNFSSLLATSGAISQTSAAMAPAGFALRVVGPPLDTWAGSSSQNINRNSAWGIGGNPNATGATSDKFVLFDSSSASSRSVDVNANYSLRGIYFKGTAAAADPFSFSGTATLTVGRGGITNYDADRQVFTAPLGLGSHQFWDAGPGGVSITNLNTNGNLLEIRSAGPSVISGAISGAGALALESGQLTLSGTSTYSGKTWIHEGALTVMGSIGASQQIVTGAPGVVRGSGTLSTLAGAGTVSPGTGPAILRAASVDPSAGMRFDFEFRAAAPVFHTAQASANDVLRFTSATPFLTPFTASNRVRIFLNVTALQAGQEFRGGFFTDATGDFMASVNGAQFDVYHADASGTVEHDGTTYSLYEGPLGIDISTGAQTADFAGGTVSGRILALNVVPEALTYAIWSGSAFPENTPEADMMPDADPTGNGVTNLLAYGLALDPIQTPLDKLPTAFIEPTESASDLVFRFRRNQLAGDLGYVVETSGDLAHWDDVLAPPTVIDPDPDGNGIAELVEIRLSITAADPAKFVRLRVELIP